MTILGQFHGIQRRVPGERWELPILGQFCGTRKQAPGDGEEPTILGPLSQNPAVGFFSDQHVPTLWGQLYGDGGDLTILGWFHPTQKRAPEPAGGETPPLPQQDVAVLKNAKGFEPAPTPSLITLLGEILGFHHPRPNFWGAGKETTFRVGLGARGSAGAGR